MPLIQTDSQHYTDIADAIRDMSGSSEVFYPADMARAINDLPVFGTLAIPIYLGSQLLYYERLSTTSTSRTNFYVATSNSSGDIANGFIIRNFNIPDGYEKQYRLSAVFNSSEANNSQLYVNDIKIVEGSSWIGTSTQFLGHYGSHALSDLFKFTDIPREGRYILPDQYNSYFNFNLRSSENGKVAWIEKVMIHCYLVKIQS